MHYLFIIIFALFGFLVFRKLCGLRHSRVQTLEPFKPVHYCGDRHHHMWVCLHIFWTITVALCNEGNTRHCRKCNPTQLPTQQTRRLLQMTKRWCCRENWIFYWCVLLCCGATLLPLYIKAQKYYHESFFMCLAECLGVLFQGKWLVYVYFRRVWGQFPFGCVLIPLLISVVWLWHYGPALPVALVITVDSIHAGTACSSYIQTVSFSGRGWFLGWLPIHWRARRKACSGNQPRNGAPSTWDPEHFASFSYITNLFITRPPRMYVCTWTCHICATDYFWFFDTASPWQEERKKKCRSFIHDT